MPNPFTMIPALYRKYVYAIYATLVFIDGGIVVGFNSAHVADPTWLTVTGEVLKYMAVPIAVLATTNVNSADRPKPAPDNPPPAA